MNYKLVFEFVLNETPLFCSLLDLLAISEKFFASRQYKIRL